jgi:chromosomal replication initiation ATPase DnaA
MAQLVLPWDVRPALGREEFVVAPANRDAAAFVDSYPAWSAPAAALHGPSGSGKSHLAAVWAAQAQAHVVEAAALGDGALAHKAVAVENLDAAAADLERDRVIFALLERGAPVLFTAQTPPSEWKVALPDLASRYRALLAFALWAPDDELLGNLARKLFADRQLGVPDAVIAEMLRSLERSPSAIRDFVARADAVALSRKRPVGIALVRELLANSAP